MARNLLSLAQRMRSHQDALRSYGNEVKKDAAKSILERLVGVTPVDTSKALSNWQIGLGEARSEDLPAYFPGDAGSTQSVSSSVALQVGYNLIDLAQPGQALHITNNAPYIIYLDQGSSQQFAGDFIGVGRVAGRVAVKERSRYRGK